MRTVVRDVAVLQVKLLVDGLRDLILVPASLIAGIVSIAKSRNGVPGDEFYKVVHIGSQSERWINLFGALENAPPGVMDDNPFGSGDIDEVLSRVESFVVDEYKRGGVSEQARDRMNEAMDRLRRRRGPKPPP